MERIALIGCGSRDWRDPAPIAKILDSFLLTNAELTVIHGAQRTIERNDAGEIVSEHGADWLIHLWCIQHPEVQEIAMPAPWLEFERLGKRNKAGMFRNEQMLQVLLALGRCEHMIAVEAWPLPQSIGTFGMMRIARKAGVDVHNHGKGIG